LQFGQLGCTAVCTQVVNAAEARLEGVETELLARPVRGLELFAGVGYLHQEFTYIDPVLLSSKALAFDRRIPTSPECSADVGAQLEHAFTDRLMFRTRIDYSYRSKQFQSIENDPFTTQPAFGLISARLALGSVDGSWEATLSGDNLTDENYIVAANPSYLTGVGISSAAYGPPRTYTFSVRYNFNP
jgi:iron complex outermembrane receptor protein